MTIQQDPTLSEDKEQHLQRYAHYYEGGVIDYDTHFRLVPNIEVYAKQAGIPEHYVYHTSIGILEGKEVKYAKTWNELPSKHVFGGYYTQKSEGYMERIYSIIGLSLRNYIDARIITLQDLITALKNGESIDNTLVCIPNLSVHKNSGGDVPSWQLSIVVGWLLGRINGKKQTIIYFEDTNTLKQQYGSLVETHIYNHFVKF